MTDDPVGDIVASADDLDRQRAKRLTTFMMIGRMMHEQEVAAGLRKPDEAQIQLTGEGWRIWGGEIEEPKPMTVCELYTGMLKEGSPEQAQKILDMTRERCKELRMASLNARGKAKQELEGHLDKLRGQLNDAIEIKKERGISSV